MRRKADAPRADTGHLGSLHIGAQEIQVPAKGCFYQYKLHNDGNDQEEQNRYNTGAEHLEQAAFIAGGLELSVHDRVCHSRDDDLDRVGNDKGLAHPAVDGRENAAADAADDSADHNADQQNGKGGVVRRNAVNGRCIDHKHRQNRRQGNRRADRQIHAARDDGVGHTQGRNADCGIRTQNVDQVAAAQKRGAFCRRDGDDD